MVDRDGPEWDEDLAEALVGSTVVIGLTWRKANGAELRREQMHGVVLRADRHKGVTLRLNGVRDGEELTLPPSTEVFDVADPGVYHLRTTGEEVENPDYTAVWSITSPD